MQQMSRFVDFFRDTLVLKAVSFYDVNIVFSGKETSSQTQTSPFRILPPNQRFDQHCLASAQWHGTGGRGEENAVMAAVSELDYQPNVFAQGLVHGHSMTIGVLTQKCRWTCLRCHVARCVAGLTGQ